MIEYVVVHGHLDTNKTFAHRVEYYLKAGYILQGGICVKDGDFAQAMTRETTAKQGEQK